MATEYKLSYTAEEIDQRLGMVNDINEVLKTVEQTIPTIDNTLTLESHAADAKVVGERIAEVGQEFEEQLGQYTKPTKASYNLFDKYNADIKNYYIRESDNLVVENDYSKAIILKCSASFGDTLLFNLWKSATELGVLNIMLCTFSEYPQANSCATTWTKNSIDRQYGRGRPTISADAEYLVLNFKWASTTTAAETNELMEQVIDNLVVVCGSDVGTYDDYPYVEKRILKVEEENLSDEIKNALQGFTPTLNYVKSKTVYLGENILGSATLGDGWTEADDVYTHATGSTEDLTFATEAEEGSVYILEFDTSYKSNEFVRVGIGDRYRTLCYQGKNHITVPLKAVGGSTLYITPITTTYAGSISNITLRKIQDSGTEFILDLYATTTDNHTQNYGFWNTFIGEDTAENAVGTTRSIAIGYCTLRDLQGGHRNIGIGTFAMSQLIGGEENISVGADSMLAVKGAEACVAIGMGAMYEGIERNGDLAIGKSALKGVPTSETSKNIGIGNNAGASITTAQSNIFIGNNAGYNTTSGLCNTFIGDGAAKAATTSRFNTAIGRNTVIPATASKCVVVGDSATATKGSQVVLGSDDITETLLKGDLIVRGTDGVKRQIVFNENGTCSWTTVE